MQRDHRLGFPAALLADIPAEKAARYPLGRPTRDPEPAPVWPFPLVKPAVTFVEDSRTPGSDKPQPVVLGVDMGAHGGDRSVLVKRSGDIFTEVREVTAREASFLAFEATLDDSEILSRLIEMRGGCRCHMGCAPCHPCSSPLTEHEALALGWEPPEPEKPAQAEPQADAGWIEHDGKGMPVSHSTHVMVRLRCGDEYEDFAQHWYDDDPELNNWVHDGGALDIVAYRVVPA